jgi:N-acyl-D-amino-acid deacylase
MIFKSHLPFPCRDGRLHPSLALVFLIALCFTALSTRAQQPAYNFIISGARVVDGTGAAWFYGDVAIKGDRIAAMGDLQKASADHRIDARGLVVSPGFIDVQGQSEFNILVDGRPPAKSRKA